MKIYLNLVLALILFSAALLQANPGDTDSTFSGDGKASYDIFGLNDNIKAMAVQQDGKVVAVGRSFTGGNTFGLIMRLKKDGTPDPSFNGNGVVLNNLLLSANSVLIQQDGKIVVGGIKTNFNDFALLRFETSGTLDQTFGQNGVTYTDFDTSEEQIQDMAIQNDGKIVAVGDASNNAFVIARYSSEGDPDPGFGSSGKQTIFVPPSSGLSAAALVIQPTGKIVVAGSASFGGNDPIFVLKRLNADGTPDQTFTTATVNFYGHGDRVSDMQILAGGKISVVGTCEDTNGQDRIAMVNFGVDGNYLQANNPALTPDMEGLALALRPDGKILVGGSSANYMAILQYTSNLGLDSSFGTGGIVNIDFTGSFEEARAILIQSDGNVVAGGAVNNPSPDVAFARVLGFDAPLLADDFIAGGPAWNVVNGNWAEDAGSLFGYGQAKATVFAPLPWSPSGLSSCSECTILFPVSTTGGERSSVSVYAWYQNSSNSVQLILKTEKGKWVLKERASGLVRKGVVKKAIEPGVTYNVGLSYDGENFLLSIDGKVLLTQPALSSPSGNVGFKVANTTAQIDQVYIY